MPTLLVAQCCPLNHGSFAGHFGIPRDVSYLANEKISSVDIFYNFFLPDKMCSANLLLHRTFGGFRVLCMATTLIVELRQ